MRGRWFSILTLWALAAGGLGCGTPPATQGVSMDDDAPLTQDEIRAEYLGLAHEAFVKGVFARETGDLRGALAHFTEAVRLSPADANLRVALVSLELELGRAREARAYLEAGIRQFGGSAQEYFLAADLRLRAGELEAASTAFDSAVALDANHRDAWLGRGRVRFRQHDFAVARQSFEAAQALGADARTLVHIAECSVALGDGERAEQALQEALRMEPELSPARRALGALYQSQGRSDEALALFEAGVPEDLEALDAALEILFQQEQYERARTLLARLHAEGSLTLRHQYLYARLLTQLGDLDQARQLLEPLAELEGTQGIEALLGEVSFRQGDYAAARQHFERATQQEAEACAPRVNLALAVGEELRADGDTWTPAEKDTVRALLAAAAARTPVSEFRCNLLLGIAYAQLRDYDLAVQHFEASHRLQPDNAELLFNLAMGHQELGHFELALQHGRRVLELVPDHAAALNFVGYLLADRGMELAASEGMVRRALEQEPENGYYIDSLGWVYYKRGEYERAAAELERAVHFTNQRDPVILEHLGDAYLKLGRLTGAYRVYKQSHELDPDNASVEGKLRDVETRLQRP